MLIWHADSRDVPRCKGDRHRATAGHATLGTTFHSGSEQLEPMMKFVYKAALLIQVILLPFSASAAKDLTNKKVLALYWYGKDFPLNVEFDRGIQEVLQSASIEYQIGRAHV